VPGVRLDLADGLRSVGVVEKSAILRSSQNRIRKKGFESLLHCDRPRPGSTASVWGRECLVQVDVQHINAEITGSCDPEHRVKIRAIHVEKRTLGVDNVRNGRDV